jgi:hypothetical protein
MNKLRRGLSHGLLLLVTGCAGEPFTVRAERAEPAAPGAILPAPFVPGPPTLSVVPSQVTLFARKGESQLACLDAATGRVSSTRVVGDVVLDVARDGDRLLVATSTDDLETSRVRAFHLEDGDLVPQGESEALGPGAHLFPYPPFTLVATEDMAVKWSLLGADLSLVPSSKAVARPASLVTTRVAGQTRLLALSTTGYEAGEHSDTLVSAYFDEEWQLEYASIPAPGRPSSRLVSAPGRDEVYLVRKLVDSDLVTFGEIETSSPGAPTALATVSVPGATGSIEAAVLDPEREALLLLLSRGSSTGALVLVPLGGAAAPTLVPLPSPVEASQWFSRALWLSASGRVIAATSAGLEACDLTGAGASLALRAATDFDGEGLLAPLVAGTDP